MHCSPGCLQRKSDGSPRMHTCISNRLVVPYTICKPFLLALDHKMNARMQQACQLCTALTRWEVKASREK